MEPAMRKDHFEVILEDINSKLEAMAEGDQVVQKMAIQLNRVEERLGTIEFDIKSIKLVVSGHNHDIADLKSIHPNMQHS